MAAEASREKRKERVKKYLNWVRQEYVINRCLHIAGKKVFIHNTIRIAQESYDGNGKENNIKRGVKFRFTPLTKTNMNSQLISLPMCGFIAR